MESNRHHRKRQGNPWGKGVPYALLAFLGTRTTNLPEAKKSSSKNEKKEKRGKTLSYERERRN